MAEWIGHIVGSLPGWLAIPALIVVIIICIVVWWLELAAQRNNRVDLGGENNDR